MPSAISLSSRIQPRVLSALAVALVVTVAGCRFSYSYRVYGNTRAVTMPSVKSTLAAVQPQQVLDAPQRSITGTITAVDEQDQRYLRLEGGSRALDIEVTLAGDEVLLPRNAVRRRATVLGEASLRPLPPDEADAALVAEGKSPRGEALSRLHVAAESLMIEPVNDLEPPRRRQLPPTSDAPIPAASVEPAANP